MADVTFPTATSSATPVPTALPQDQGIQGGDNGLDASGWRNSVNEPAPGTPEAAAKNADPSNRVDLRAAGAAHGPAAAQPEPSDLEKKQPFGGSPKGAGFPPVSADTLSKPPVDPAVQAAQKKGGLFYALAESLAGGPHFKTTVDPISGDTKREAVHLSGQQIGLAIALEALTGGLAGLGAKGPNHLGQAAALGMQQGRQLQKQKSAEEDKEAEAQQKNFNNRAAIANTNMQMMQHAMSLSGADRAMHQMNVDSYAPMYKLLQDQNAIKDVVDEPKLNQMLQDGSAHVTRDMAIPIQVVQRMGPDGQPAKGAHGEPLWDNKYALIDPNAKIELPQEARDLLKKYRVPGYVNSDGKEITLPDNLELRAHRVADGIEQANLYRSSQSEVDGYAKGQTNYLHSDTAPKVGAVGTTGGGAMVSFKDSAITSLVDEAATTYGIDRGLLRSLVMAESGGNPKAVSDRGAQGLGQLMPATAKSVGVTDPFDPKQNIDGAAHFFQKLLSEHHGDEREALIAYHGKKSDGKTTGAQYADIVLGKRGPQQPGGMLESGNIDLHARPISKNADGGYSTVKSKSFEFDGKEVLLPTIADDGHKMTDEEAIANYKATGKHLGVFDSAESATAYANSLHQSQASEYDSKAKAPDLVEAVHKGLLSTDDLRVKNQLGGLDAFTEGKPGTPSPADMAAKADKTGKVGAAVSHIKAYLNQIKPIEDVRQEREAATAVNKETPEQKELRQAQLEHTKAETAKIMHEIDTKGVKGDFTLAEPFKNETPANGVRANYLANLPDDYRETVKAIGENRQWISPYAVGRGGKAGEINPLVAMVHNAYPGYDFTKAKAYQDARSTFTSKKVAEQISGINTALNHLKTMYDNASTDGSIPLIGGLEREFGNDRANNLQAARAGLHGELPRIYKGGVPDKEDSEKWDQVLNKWIAAGQKSSAKSVITLLDGKLDALAHQWITSAPPGATLDLMSPEAEAAYEAIMGHEPKTIKTMRDAVEAHTNKYSQSQSGPAGEQPPVGASAPPASALKQGVHTTFKNGQTWTLQNGKPTQVQGQ